MRRADGQKFGKTAAGTIWLDPERTLPYELHQYFLAVDDRDVERFLLQLTMIGLDEIAEIVAEHNRAPELRYGQRRLADAVTELVHGADEVRRSNLAAGVLFGDQSLTVESLEALRGIIPETVRAPEIIGGDEAVVDVLVSTEVCSSRGDARRAIEQGGVHLNGERVTTGADTVAAIGGRFVLIQRGKKQRHLLVLQG
jgi:tyrosyl-tRNA synthetase